MKNFSYCKFKIINTSLNLNKKYCGKDNLLLFHIKFHFISDETLIFEIFLFIKNY